jgi:cobalt-zinc-cadmium efflux system membrane fusion protein
MSLQRERRVRALGWRVELVIVAALALVAAAGYGGVALIDQLVTTPSKAASAPALPPPPGMFRATAEEWAGLRFAPVRLLRFATEDQAEGKIATDEDLATPVFSPYSGRVTRLFARAGDHVVRGAPLFAIAATQLVHGANDLIKAVDTLATARARLNLARTDEQREHALYEAKGAALKNWQKAQVTLAAAQGSFRSAEIAVATARNNLRILGESDAEISAIENAPDTFLMNPQATVYAPISGTVIKRRVGLGQYLRAGGSKPVFTIGDMAKVWLLANVPEEEAPAMRLGEPVEVHVLAFPGRVFKARLTYVAPAIDPDTYRLAVRAEVDNPNGELKPGMFADFTIVTGHPVTAPAVPAEAVVYHGRRAQVWVTGKNKTLGLREIRVGRTQDGMIEVRAGLSPGETVATQGALFINRAAEGVDGPAGGGR